MFYLRKLYWPEDVERVRDTVEYISRRLSDHGALVRELPPSDRHYVEEEYHEQN